MDCDAWVRPTEKAAWHIAAARGGEESSNRGWAGIFREGFRLNQWVRKGLPRFHGVRSTLYGLEQYLVSLHNLGNEFHPFAVAVDPIANLMVVGEPAEVKSMPTRMIDFLKNKGTTALFAGLTEGGGPVEQTEAGVSSSMDTWLLLRNVEAGGERNRLLFILKSRGMAHSNQVREFRLTDEGIPLRDVYVGPGAVLTGSTRVVQEAKAQAVSERQSIARRRRELEQEQAELARVRGADGNDDPGRKGIRGHANRAGPQDHRGPVE